MPHSFDLDRKAVSPILILCYREPSDERVHCSLIKMKLVFGLDRIEGRSPIRRVESRCCCQGCVVDESCQPGTGRLTVWLLTTQKTYLYSTIIREIFRAPKVYKLHKGNRTSLYVIAGTNQSVTTGTSLYLLQNRKQSVTKQKPVSYKTGTSQFTKQEPVTYKTGTSQLQNRNQSVTKQEPVSYKAETSWSIRCLPLDNGDLPSMKFKTEIMIESEMQIDYKTMYN